MPRKEMERVSADGKYGLNWGSDGAVYIVDISTGEELIYLFDNEPVCILRAVFSHDMHRILCFNWGGTVGVWSTPRELRGKPYGRDIVEAIGHQRDQFTVRQALPGFRRGD